MRAEKDFFMFLWEKAMEQFSIMTFNGFDPRSVSNTHKIKLRDSDGYRYYLSRQNLGTVGKRGQRPARFFDLNPYTEYNIARYLKMASRGDVVIEHFDAKNAHDPIELYCKSQDAHYTKSWNELQQGAIKKVTLDKFYANPHVKITILDVRCEWKRKFGVNVIESKYLNNHTPIRFICPKHEQYGEQSTVYAGSDSAKHLCIYCAQEATREFHINRGRTNFYSKLEAQKNPDVIVIGEYTGRGEKIACICKKCGIEFSLRPDHILRGIGCGKCTLSIGERKIEESLNVSGIRFIPQHVFDDCKLSWKPMPFDFFLPDLNTVVEFDGEQHFRAVDHFGGQEEFERLQKRDRFKTDYCKRNNINLIRIPYTEINNIEQYIEPLAKAALSLRQNTL